MWFLALKHLKEEFKKLGVNVFIGIKSPPDTKQYPFIALTPVEFYQTTNQQTMKVSILFGLVSRSKEPEEGTNELLNFMTDIEKILDNNKTFMHFVIEDEKATASDFTIREPYYLAEMVILISSPRVSYGSTTPELLT